MKQLQKLAQMRNKKPYTYDYDADFIMIEKINTKKLQNIVYATK